MCESWDVSVIVPTFLVTYFLDLIAGHTRENAATVVPGGYSLRHDVL